MLRVSRQRWRAVAPAAPRPWRATRRGATRRSAMRSPVAWCGWLVAALLLAACGGAARAPRAAPADGAVTPVPAAAAGATAPSPAGDDAAVASFYRGKTIRLLVGTAAGGSYDVIARVVARHLGKQVPGNPTVIVENMPGANNLVAANYLYRI